MKQSHKITALTLVITKESLSEERNDEAISWDSQSFSYDVTCHPGGAVATKDLIGFFAYAPAGHNGCHSERSEESNNNFNCAFSR